MMLNILVITDDIDQWFDKFSQSLSNAQSKYSKSYRCVYNDLFCIDITNSINNDELLIRSYSQVIIDKHIDDVDFPFAHCFPVYTMEYRCQHFQALNYTDKLK